ncbi:hypothetical protein GF374_00685 [Candidatus Woesearchaeota archaeon]|nr:hypothetical protein [Candidatus Woesearchaeota archaeon]
MRKVCYKKERMQIDNKIEDLAKELLSLDVIEKADRLSQDISYGKKKKREGIEFLEKFVKPRPKRPMYYCHFELHHLPHYTRNIVRYLGDYIDLLERQALKKFLGDSYKERISPKSVRTQLQPFIPKNLFQQLEEYDKIFWTPGKHDFNVDEKNRRHRFTTREVIYDIFITYALADEIKTVADIEDSYKEEVIYYGDTPEKYFIEL